MSQAQPTSLTIPLRSGEMCALHGDSLRVGQREIPLRDITAAGLVADISAPPPPGMPPTPGVSLRLSDGSFVAFTPAEQLDCWRLLHALAGARPELRGPLPPPPGAQGATGGYVPVYAPGIPPGYPPGYPPPYGMVGPGESERTLAGICHLSVFFAPVILPLIIWLAMQRSQPYASQQAKQAFWFHLFYALIAVIAVVSVQIYIFSTVFQNAATSAAPNPAVIGITVLPAIYVLYGLLAIAGIVNIVFSVIAAVHGFQGKPYHYPLLGFLAR